MVSFRNSQFQAILTGLVMADAVSQGQLLWPLLETDQGPTGQSTAGAIADDGWCHAIAAALTSSSTTESPATMSLRSVHEPAHAIAVAPPSIAALLTALPRLLINLDRQPPTPFLTPCATPNIVSLSTLFYDCLQTSLRQDAATLSALGERLQAVALTATPSASVTGLQTAIERVLVGQGDFQIAVGHSLQSLTAPPGSTLLTAIFSAAWGDLPSLPMWQRHCLHRPSAALQAWLQQRWHIASGSELTLWAEVLWQQWSGQHPGTLGRTPMVTIQPLAAQPKLFSL